MNASDPKRTWQVSDLQFSGIWPTSVLYEDCATFFLRIAARRQKRTRRAGARREAEVLRIER
jgi:hypothetical protein